MSQSIIREADRDEILPLRYAVLCTGRPWAEALFTGDDDPQTHHFGAFARTNRGWANVGCVSYMMMRHDDEPEWQLRGMAVRPDMSRAGMGRQLVHETLRLLLSVSPVRQFWRKARVPAIPFYEKLGWKVCSEEFIVEHYGPHKSMLFTM